jgi:hypothetical protein
VSVAQTSKGSKAGAVECLALAHESDEHTREQGAQRAALLGGDHPDVADKILIELEGNFRFQGAPCFV